MKIFVESFKIKLNYEIALIRMFDDFNCSIPFSNPVLQIFHK